MNKYSSYILYLLLSILVAILSINDFGPLAGLQRTINDALCSFTASDGMRPNVLLVRIDDRAQEKFGPLPWNHDLVADLTAAVSTGEPKAIVLDMELSEDADQDSAGYTDILAQQLQFIPQTILRYDIALATYRSNKTSNPDELFKNSITVEDPLGLMDENASLLVRKVFLPADKLLDHKPLMGFHYHRPDNDRLLRHQPLLMNYEGFYYPSVSLLAAAAFLDIPTDQIKAVENEEVQLGLMRRVPINTGGDFYVNYSRGVPFMQYSASDVLSDEFKFNMFKGKVVLIGPSDMDAVEVFETPVEPATSSMVVKGTIIENIINDNMLEIRDDLATVSLLIILALGGICAFVLPRVSLMYRMIILGGALILLANANYLLFSTYHMVVETVY
ncbi:CHASE2 domain-containing protein, partial [candidate division GN15 bacterium]|nr:CHASE2 domain-containing protein [candidate division GN15 bacterium]